MTSTNTVTSRDGTTIAYDRSGEGPAVILIGGATGVRRHPMMVELAAALAEHFTVINYDRRGRGDSGDNPAYAVEREVEDIDVLIDACGGSASLYGISSGAVLALDAATTLARKIDKVAMYEPPFIVDDSRPPLPSDYVDQLDTATSSGRPGDAVEIFYTQALGIPAEYLAPMRADPSWSETEAVAQTIAYDGRIMGSTMSGRPLPSDRWNGAIAPVLVATGGNSEPFFHTGANALADLLPNVERRTLDGQYHDVATDALAPVLIEFFAR
jgi:pimeloyl-ACP methyl ester carboxylesterase